MSENIISQISHTISNDIDLSQCQEEALCEIELSIKKINTLIENEKVREKLVTNELKIENYANINTLEEYLISIEKNIRKLTLFLEILHNKKKLFLFDAKNYFNSIQEKTFEEHTSLS